MNDYIVILSRGDFLNFCEEVICQIKDRRLLNEETNSFTFQDLLSAFPASDSDDNLIKLKLAIKSYFQIEKNPNQMEEEGTSKADELTRTSNITYSFQKITRFCIDQCLYRENTWILEDIISIITDALEMYLPAKIRSSFPKEERMVFLSRELQKKGIIQDSVDYKRTSGTCLKDDTRVIYFDYITLPDEPVER